MRIAFLCKRRYMSKDVIADRYARLYEIPYQLARLGHTVEAFCLDYLPSGFERRADDASPGYLRWTSRSVGKSVLPALVAYPGRLLRAVRAFAPDVVIGASDIPHVALGYWLARCLKRPYVADLYDNFEGFGQARLPGMVPALRHAVRHADVVLTTSEPLRQKVMLDYQARGEVIAMPSSVDLAVFHPRDKAACRAKLGLPPDALLVGTAGGLSREKGISVLYEAWHRLAPSHPRVHLVLAGPVEASLPIPAGERVHYLGLLAHARVAELFCALDVGVMCVPDTPFGRYCFPQKAYEMIACHLPFVASRVGAMEGLLAKMPECLFRADDASHLVDRLLQQLALPRRPAMTIKDWRATIQAIEPSLMGLVNK
jgi:glycosyltransferase involved in cell wall biosynthesis